MLNLLEFSMIGSSCTHCVTCWRLIDEGARDDDGDEDDDEDDVVDIRS